MTLLPEDIVVLNARKIPYSSCFTLTSDGTFLCNTSKISDCRGWPLPNKELCDSDLRPISLIQNDNASWISDAITEINFDDIALYPGQIYGGGIFVGVYDSGIAITFNDNINSPLGSTGAIKTTNTKYAIILKDKTIYAPFLTTAETITKDTSYFDGFYNKENIECYLHDTVLETNINTEFIDWYVPSISELTFIRDQMTSYDLLRSIVARIIGEKLIVSSTIFKDRTNTFLQYSFLHKKLHNYGLDFSTNVVKYINSYVEANMLLIRMIPIE